MTESLIEPTLAELREKSKTNWASVDEGRDWYDRSVAAPIPLPLEGAPPFEIGYEYSKIIWSYRTSPNPPKNWDEFLARFARNKMLAAGSHRSQLVAEQIDTTNSFTEELQNLFFEFMSDKPCMADRLVLVRVWRHMIDFSKTGKRPWFRHPAKAANGKELDNLIYWRIPLVIQSTFGFSWHKTFAQDWHQQFSTTCGLDPDINEREYNKQVTDAHRASGLPGELMSVSLGDFSTHCKKCHSDDTPVIFSAMNKIKALVYLFTHLRRVKRIGGDYLAILSNGRAQFLEVGDEAKFKSDTKRLRRVLDLLDLPFMAAPKSKKNATPRSSIRWAVQAVLGDLCLNDLMEMKPLSERPMEVLMSPQARIVKPNDYAPSSPVEYGLQLEGVFKLGQGKIWTPSDQEAESLLSEYDWKDELDANRGRKIKRADWLTYVLPQAQSLANMKGDTGRPATPAELFHFGFGYMLVDQARKFYHIAALTAPLLADIWRFQNGPLATYLGSEIGFFLVSPAEIHSQDDGTGGGKSTACVALARVHNPLMIELVGANSANQQNARVLTWIVQRLGTFCAGEYVVTRGAEGPLAPANLQGMLTGAEAGIGLAYENSKAIRLMLSIQIGCKSLEVFPKDLLDRATNIFLVKRRMDHIDTGGEYLIRSKEIIPLAMRLALQTLVEDPGLYDAAVRYADKVKFSDEIRFPGTAGITLALVEYLTGKPAQYELLQQHKQWIREIVAQSKQEAASAGLTSEIYGDTPARVNMSLLFEKEGEALNDFMDKLMAMLDADLGHLAQNANRKTKRYTATQIIEKAVECRTNRQQTGIMAAWQFIDDTGGKAKQSSGAIQRQILNAFRNWDMNEGFIPGAPAWRIMLSKAGRNTYFSFRRVE